VFPTLCPAVVPLVLHDTRPTRSHFSRPSRVPVYLNSYRPQPAERASLAELVIDMHCDNSLGTAQADVSAFARSGSAATAFGLGLAGRCSSARPRQLHLAAPATNFEPARKLRRDVTSVAFPWAEPSNEFPASTGEPMRMSKPFICNFAPLVEFERKHSSARLDARRASRRELTLRYRDARRRLNKATRFNK